MASEGHGTTAKGCSLKDLLIYESAVPLQVEVHGDVSVQRLNDYRFSVHVNSVPIVAAEFAAVASDMTIVFAGTEKAVVPAALLGLTADHNSFVDTDGKWTGRYIPAFLRRYPFVFAARPESDELTLCVDESYAGLNDQGIGERLFDAEGNRTLYLQSVLDFAVQYQAQHERTRLFCDRLISLGLLESVVATFLDANGEERRLSGFFRINRDRLKAIDGATLAAMFANDELELCFTHLASLANIDRLSDRAAAVPSAPMGKDSGARVQ